MCVCVSEYVYVCLCNVIMVGLNAKTRGEKKLLEKLQSGIIALIHKVKDDKP